MTISKLSEKCKKCSHVDNCNEKRMEACAVMQTIPELNLTTFSVPTINSINQSILRDTSARAQIEEQISRQITKKLENDFYNQYHYANCYFK